VNLIRAGAPDPVYMNLVRGGKQLIDSGKQVEEAESERVARRTPGDLASGERA